MPRLSALLLIVLAGCATSGAPGAATSSPDDPPALAAITADDLRRDLFVLAGDGMRGREAGTLDELRASAWLADRAREAGLEPAGDDGTYFQWWSLRRVRVSGASRVSVGGSPLALWRDVGVASMSEASVDAPLVWVGDRPAAEIAEAEVRGKAVVAVVRPPARPPERWVSLWGWRYTNQALNIRRDSLVARGAAAVVLVGDSIAESNAGRILDGQMRGRYLLDSAGADRRPPPGATPVLFVRRATAERLRAAEGQRLVASIQVESFAYPSVNVVARVRGTDPGLRDEHVLFSGHQDHDGVRTPLPGDPADSIWNGADDEATVSVALLAIGRAFARAPARRSALFVWHGAEERGLIGSRHHAANPVVPRASIVAVLNADMIGRNHPDTAALLGSQPPHRNSTALVNMALRANDRITRFVVDSSWDRPSHPEGWYFRSDHLPYARLGIPSLFFTTLLHPDYHTPRDEPQRIDVAKMARVTRWMYATGWAAAMAHERPGVDPGFRLER